MPERPVFDDADRAVAAPPGLPPTDAGRKRAMRTRVLRRSLVASVLTAVALAVVAAVSLGQQPATPDIIGAPPATATATPTPQPRPVDQLASDDHISQPGTWLRCDNEPTPPEEPTPSVSSTSDCVITSSRTLDQDRPAVDGILVIEENDDFTEASVSCGLTITPALSLDADLVVDGVLTIEVTWTGGVTAVDVTIDTTVPHDSTWTVETPLETTVALDGVDEIACSLTFVADTDR